MPLTPSGRSLYRIAPRLAVAHRQRSLEVSVLDEYEGDLFAIEHARHHATPCPCGGRRHVHHVTRRILQGGNRGVLVHATVRECDTCDWNWWSSW